MFFHILTHLKHYAETHQITYISVSDVCVTEAEPGGLMGQDN